jgi:hypothetical protein
VRGMTPPTDVVNADFSPKPGMPQDHRVPYLTAVDGERVARKRRSTFLGLPGYGD